jgi:hypothetical protein
MLLLTYWAYSHNTCEELQVLSKNREHVLRSLRVNGLHGNASLFLLAALSQLSGASYYGRTNRNQISDKSCFVLLPYRYFTCGHLASDTYVWCTLAQRERMQRTRPSVTLHFNSAIIDRISKKLWNWFNFISCQSKRLTRTFHVAPYDVTFDYQSDASGKIHKKFNAKKHLIWVQIFKFVIS